MKVLVLVTAITLILFPFALCAEPLTPDKIMSDMSQDDEMPPEKIIASFDLSREEKVDGLMESGFRVAGTEDVKSLFSLLPEKIRPEIDGDLYFRNDPGIAVHYVFFIGNPGEWVSALKSPAPVGEGWMVSESRDFSREKPLVFLNITKGISITVTFWRKSPPTCQVTELHL
ncbi:MAG: hypothetical protein GTN70_03695 [Deltaproteobacteria bacterium]|nr:hypothetical protein [Deltaproteobacteria bacterium]NIS76756.1 hypothetical protein [Deltaproteobacteria bacterium]